MAKAHGMQQHSQPQKAPSQQQQQQQPSQIGGSSKEASETPIICHICDKVIYYIMFKDMKSSMNRTSVIIGNEFRRVKSNLIELLGTYIGA
jgi:hypothetical protein